MTQHLVWQVSGHLAGETRTAPVSAPLALSRDGGGATSAAIGTIRTSELDLSAEPIGDNATERSYLTAYGPAAGDVRNVLGGKMTPSMSTVHRACTRCEVGCGL